MGNKKIEEIYDRAKKTLSKNSKVKQLLSEVGSRIEKMSMNSEERSVFVNQTQMIIRMLRAHIQGVYRAFSASTLLTLVFGLAYFITPIDLIPDFIPALGFTDDISLIFLIFRSLSDDIERFKSWEETAIS